MKLRFGHVTNSSSSSFIIAKKYLDEDQIKAINNHYELAKKLGLDIDYYSYWHIEENDDFITGYTDLDNFSMYDFLNTIDVKDKHISWSEWPFNIDSYEDNEDDDLTEPENKDWRDIIYEM